MRKKIPKKMVSLNEMSLLAWPKRKVWYCWLTWHGLILWRNELRCYICSHRTAHIDHPLLLSKTWQSQNNCQTRKASCKHLENLATIPTYLRDPKVRDIILIMDSTGPQNGISYDSAKSQRLLLPHVCPWHTCANWCNAKHIRPVRSDYAWWMIKQWWQKGCPTRGAKKNQGKRHCFKISCSKPIQNI